MTWSRYDRCTVRGRGGWLWGVYYPQVETPLVESLGSTRAPGLTPGAGVGEAIAEVFFDDGGVLPETVSLSDLEPATPNESEGQKP